MFDIPIQPKTEHQMRVIIAGGRNFIPKKYHAEWLLELHKRIKMTCVISGMADGADLFGWCWARDNKIKVEEHPADWDQFGKSAGPIRNREMAKCANAVVLFPGGRGTADMKQVAIECGLEIYEWCGITVHERKEQE